MEKIIIEDEEIFSEIISNIKEIKDRINASTDMKLLNETNILLDTIKERINKYSTYNIKEISNIIAKLMCVFEGVEYKITMDEFIHVGRYHVEPKEYYAPRLYKSYYMDTKADICILYPSFYLNNQGEVDYIQKFIDYLYSVRSLNNNLDLDEALNSFIRMSMDEQNIRREEINRRLDEINKQKERKSYEDSCLIDRDLMFNAIYYIISNFEEDMNVTKVKEEHKYYSGQWTTLEGIHKLTIELDGTSITYDALIDKNGCYPDEEYCGLYVNMNTKTMINFFDIKNSLKRVINKSKVLEELFNRLEGLYVDKPIITNDDIEPILAGFRNKQKIKVY